MKKHFVILFTFLSFTLSAQDLKLFETSYSIYPATEITEGTNGQEAEFKEFSISIRIPTVFNEGQTVLLNGLQYNRVSPEFSGSGTSAQGDLHFLAYSVTLVKQLQNAWQFIGTFTPAISSDLEGSLSRDDFLFLGAATIGKTVNEGFKWNAGLAFTSSFGEPLVVPLVELYSKKNDFKFHILFPTKIEGMFVKENVEYGLRIGLAGSQFNLETTATQPVDDIKFSRINVGPAVSFGVSEHIFLSLFGGLSTGRKYDATSSTLGDFDFSSEDGFFLRFGLFFR